jgi:2-polyprenyl-3-methyl-5-hydroxy-6-metoxy-1,4-benzoquinol methylase
MKEAAARTGQLNGASVDIVASAEFLPLRRGSSATALSELDLHPIHLQPRFQPRSDARYHVNDLLKYHDGSFIQNAYRAILKRGPDGVGYKTFLESLRSAQLNKIDILARLRYSAEGRAKQVEIEGLWLPAMIRKAYRVPLLGYLLNLVIALARLPLLIRGQQQFEAHMLAQLEMIVEHMNHVDRSLLAHADEVSQIFQAQGESSQTLGVQLREQIDQIRAQLDQSQQQTLQETQTIREKLQDVELETGRWFAETVRQREQLAKRLSEKISEQQELISTDIQKRTSELTSLVDVRGDELKGLVNIESDRRGAEVGRLEQRLSETGVQLTEISGRWQESLKAVETRLLQWQLGLRVKETQLTHQFTQADANQREQLERTAKQLTGEIARIFEKQQQVNTELVLQGERLGAVLAEARKRLPEPFDEEQLRALAKEEDHTLDAFYASFDEQFRGSRVEIKQRLRVYLPIIQQQEIGSAEMPILDVGSGRGEWLELLKEEGLQARGVDSNRILVEWCQNRDLEVSEEDLLQYFQQLPDASLGAVTGFHIIEHLTIEVLVEFLNQTVRVLKPGGAIIFETPNPQNVLVGSCNFYFDPTHRNPLPSQVTKFLVESRGFSRVEVLNLNPSDDTPVDENSDLARRFNKYFYGPMDYAVVGFRS